MENLNILKLSDKPIKVLFVGSGKPSTGVSPIIINQGESLEAFGISVSYFSIDEKGIKGYYKSIGRLKEYLKSNSFELIHAHYGWCGIVARLARKHEKIITSFMGDDIVGSNREDGSITLISKVFALVNIFLGRFIYDRSIVKSKEMLARSGTRNFLLIPNGVNLQKFKTIEKQVAREKLNIPLDQKLLIFVSNPDRVEKNFLLSQQACEILKEKNIVLKPVFHKSIDELVLFYAAADVMVMTSFHEGSPNVIKEALACGIPAVSTDVGDVKWIFGEEPGYYLSSFEPLEVAKKISLAFEYAEIHNRTRGRERILSIGLDSDTVANKIVGVYREILRYPKLQIN